jgi:hypothetical protein
MVVVVPADPLSPCAEVADPEAEAGASAVAVASWLPKILDMIELMMLTGWPPAVA